MQNHYRLVNQNNNLIEKELISLDKDTSNTKRDCSSVIFFFGIYKKKEFTLIRISKITNSLLVKSAVLIWLNAAVI